MSSPLKIEAAPDGVVDRIDRALWLTPPYSKQAANPTAPPTGGYVARQSAAGFVVVRLTT